MRYSAQKLKDLASSCPHVNNFSENAILTSPKFIFDYRSGQMGTANQKNGFVKFISRTNEAAGLFVLSLIQLKIIPGFHGRCLFGPESTLTSSPKILPTPLILLGSNKTYPLNAESPLGSPKKMHEFVCFLRRFKKSSKITAQRTIAAQRTKIHPDKRFLIIGKTAFW
jgi:hypothetical protein